LDTKRCRASWPCKIDRGIIQNENFYNPLLIYQKRLRPGITGEFLMKALTNTSERLKLTQILKSFRDTDVAHRLDGAMVYHVEKDVLHFYGIPFSRKEKVKESKIAVKDIPDKKKFQEAVCKSLTTLYSQRPI
jgi:hypothetical protein